VGRREGKSEGEGRKKKEGRSVGMVGSLAVVTVKRVLYHFQELVDFREISLFGLLYGILQNIIPKNEGGIHRIHFLFSCVA
jgi:hypothetical protein